MIATAEQVESAPVDPARAVEKLIPWVRSKATKLAAKVFVPGVDVDDLTQEGLLALYKAVRDRHDRSRGVGIMGYARLRVVGAMIDHLRAQGITSRSENLRMREGEPAPRERVGLEIVLQMVAEESPDAGDGPRAEFVATIRRLCPDLPASTRSILAHYYVDGLTMKEVGVEVGLSESRVSQRMTDATDALRAALLARGHTALTALALT
jgi:RNA polymerase sigma factor (sigma-70 family)